MLKKILSLVLIFTLVLTLAACGESEPEYTMKDESMQNLVFRIPSQFELEYSGDGERSYSTNNARIGIYRYTSLEIQMGFTDFTGEFTATAFAEYIVNKEGYNCEIDITADGTQANYSFYHTDNSGNYYYFSNLIVTGERELYMVVLSCYSEKLSFYKSMFEDTLSSVKLESKTAQ